MTDRPSREEELFNAALELASEAERAAWLERECAGDAGLRANVEALLRASGVTGGGFLDAPAAGVPDPARPRGTMVIGGTMVLDSSVVVTPGSVSKAASGYTVGGEIARGGMGSILEAEDRRLGRKLAMKVMRLEAAASDDARTRFVRKTTVLARLERAGGEHHAHEDQGDADHPVWIRTGNAPSDAANRRPSFSETLTEA